MPLTMIYFLTYVCEALILFQYCHSILKTKKTLAFHICVLCVCYGSMFAVSFFQSFIINTLAFLLLNALYIQVVYSPRWYFTIFNSLVITIMMSLSELLVASIFPQIVYNFQKEINTDLMLIFALVSKLIFFFMLNLIAKVFSSIKDKEISHGTETFLLTIISLIIFWTMISFMLVCQYLNLPHWLSTIVTICTVLLFLLNFMVIWFYNNIQKKNQNYLHLQMELQKESDLIEYHQALLKEDQNQKILIHDIRKHLQTIAYLNNSGSTKEVADYIEHLTNSADLQTTATVCDSPLLNGILSRYIRLCQENHITFRPDIRNRSINFLSDDDLTALFCNLMDNATTAAALCTSAYIELNVSRKEESSLTIITLVNSCEQNPISSSGKLISNKPNARWHGYGLKSIERIAEHYQGAMQFYYDSENRAFHTIVTVYGKPRYNP